MDVRFNLAIRNAIQRRQQPLQTAAVRATSADIRPKKKGIKQHIKKIGRPLRQRIRAYLTGALSAQLEVLGGKVDALDRKIDALLVFVGQVEDLHGKTDRLLDTANQVVQLRNQFDQLRPRVDHIGNQFDQLRSRVDQIVSRMVIDIDPATAMVRTPDGYLLVPKSDERLLAVLCESGTSGMEPGTRWLLLQLINPGMTVIDAGAHVGSLLLPVARHLGQQGRVLAFEPTPSVCALLRRTISLNGLEGRVAVHEAALGHTSGRALLHVSSVVGHNSLYAFDPDDALAIPERDIEVDVRRLDDVVPAGTPIHLVKMDVEGAELDVLSGMQRVLAENPDLAIVAEFGPSHLKRTGHATENWVSTFSACGFDLFVINEDNGQVSPCEVSRLASIYSANILALRRGSVFSAKIGL